VVNYFGVRRDYQEADFEKLIPERIKMLEDMPKTQAELPPRKMKDSFVSALIPLKTSWKLRDRYTVMRSKLNSES
jgi:hypothetical protein